MTRQSKREAFMALIVILALIALLSLTNESKDIRIMPKSSTYECCTTCSTNLECEVQCSGKQGKDVITILLDLILM
jgi:hypothetical protein